MRTGTVLRIGLAAAGLAIAAGLAACQYGDLPPLEKRPGDPPMSELRARQAECLAQGGNFAPAGLYGHACFLATPDAGKACSRASDCTDTCLADTRTCNPVSPMFGCYGFLDADGNRIDICVD